MCNRVLPLKLHGVITLFSGVTIGMNLISCEQQRYNNVPCASVKETGMSHPPGIVAACKTVSDKMAASV